MDNETNELGRVAEGEQALVNEAATHLHPAGFDPSRKFRVMGFATGWYFGKCATCAAEFMGDKRARDCLACAAVEADHVILLQRREIAELKARQSPISDDKLREILWRHLGGDDRYTAIRYAISDIRELAQGMETGTAETLAALGDSLTARS